MSTGVRWTGTLLAHLPPGRGVGVLPPPKKKAPTLTALWNGAHAGFRTTYAQNPEGELVQLLERTAEVFANRGKAHSLPDWDDEVFGMAIRVSMLPRDSWSDDGGGAYKIVRYTLARGGREAISSWIAATRMGMDRRWQSGWRCETWRSTKGEIPADLNRRHQNPWETALKELRLGLALADPTVYDDAVATAREAWGGISDPVRASLVFLLPTLVDEAVALATAPDALTNPIWRSWLTTTGQRPEAFLELAAATRTPEALLYPLAGCGEVAGPALINLAQRVPSLQPQILGPLACLPNEQSAAFLARWPESPVVVSFFMDQPELALEFVPEDHALMQDILRAHPQFDPDAAPQASDDELPELFGRPIKGKLKGFEHWKAYADLKLTDSDKVLSPAQMEQLGKLLCKANGRPPKADRAAIRQTLDADSREAFAAAVCDAFFSQTDRYEGRWMIRALQAFGEDALVDRLATEAKSSDYPTQVAIVEVVQHIGSDHALIRLAHFANKGQGRGFKNAAKAALALIAHERGLEDSQLQDRLVPTLGLDPRGRMTLDYGPRRFIVGFDEKLKPYVVDDAGKRRVNLPKPGKKDAAHAVDEERRWKQLKKDARTIASTQISRFEESLRNQRRWPQEEFTNFLARHPLIGHITRRLVWGIYTAGGRLQASFRVDEEGDWVDAEDEPLPELPGQVGLVHPLHLDEADRTAWGDVLADYEILQPIEQLARPTYPSGSPTSDAVLAQVEGATVKGGNLYRLLNAGWNRGSVEDGGNWYEAWTTGEGYTLTVVTSHGVGISGGYGAGQESLVHLKIRQNGPNPVGWSEAIRDLKAFLG